MTCSTVNVEGHTVILCGRDRIHACVVCGEIAGYLCDWRRPAGGTCDAAICKTHRINVGISKDLCPDHAKVWENHPANKQQEFAL